MNGGKEEISGKRRKPEWWSQFWMGTALFVSILVVVQCVAYFLSYIDLYKLFIGLMALFLGIPPAYAIGYIKTEVISEKVQLRINRIAFIGAGLPPPLRTSAI